MIPAIVNSRLTGRPFILNLSWGPSTGGVYSGRGFPRPPLSASCNTRGVFTRRMSSLRRGALTKRPLALYSDRTFHTWVFRDGKRHARFHFHGRGSPVATVFVDTSFIYYFQMPLVCRAVEVQLATLVLHGRLCSTLLDSFGHFRHGIYVH